MIAFFILLALAIISMFFFGFFWGKTSGFNKVEKWSEKELPQQEHKKVKSFTELYSCASPLFLFVYFGLMFLCILFGTLSDVKDTIINRYEKGEYVKVISSNQYQLNDSTKVEKTYEPRYITKKNYEKKMKDD